MIKRLFALIEKDSPIHSKYLKKVALSKDDEAEFENLLCYYEKCGVSLHKQAEAYLLCLNDTLNETKYFLENKAQRYRYASFDEVKNKVYLNEQYMKDYMIGLAISSYIWETHIKVRKFFVNFLASLGEKECYLEIGPGHGEFFARALKFNAFKRYVGIDLSPTSIAMTRDIIAHQAGEKFTQCEFLCEDFYESKINLKADFIVIGEILEHLENPLLFLQKLKNLLAKGGEVFVTAPINAPAIDHIYLFKHPDELRALFDKAGLFIKQEECFMANDYSLEKALKYKNAIIMTAVLGGK